MGYPTPKPTEVLLPTEINAVIEAMFYRMLPEQRVALMAACPVAYTKLCGGHPTIKEEVLKQVAKAMGEMP